MRTEEIKGLTDSELEKEISRARHLISHLEDDIEDLRLELSDAEDDLETLEVELEQRQQAEPSIKPCPYTIPLPI